MIFLLRKAEVKQVQNIVLKWHDVLRIAININANGMSYFHVIDR